MSIFIAEFIGSAILLLLGCGVCACVTLNKSHFKDAGIIVVTFGWGFAVLIPAFIFANVSGAHFNPALTIALAVDGTISWSVVPQYLAGEFLGALFGAFWVWLLYKEQFDATESGDAKKGVFCTSPGARNYFLNFLSEFTCAFILVFAIKGIGNWTGQNFGASGVGMFFVFAIILACGMSLGGLTGYAMNPTRDLCPRIIHALVPFKSPKADSDWSYAWIPVVAPIVGGVAAALLYQVLFTGASPLCVLA